MHTNRPVMKTPPSCSFEQVFNNLKKYNKGEYFLTKKGTQFTAEARYTTAGEPYILLSHNNRIYQCCWGNMNNHMGKEGQRIGQYTYALDCWCKKLQT